MTLRVAFGADDANECVDSVRTFIADRYDLVPADGCLPESTTVGRRWRTGWARWSPPVRWRTAS